MGLLLLRYGELALKGHNRTIFVRLLRHNVRAALKAAGVPGRVRTEGARVLVETDAPEALEGPLSRVFGLTSLSTVTRVPREIEAIAEECVRQARIAGVGPAVSYRVQARRADKTFPLTSPEINRAAGEAIARALDGRIDLSKSANVTIGVEVRADGALIYGHVIPAPGGLPVGTEGRVVALLSGGIDSPVAAWMMMKRGCQVIPLHFQQNEVEAAKALDNVAQLSRYPSSWQLRPVVLDHVATIAPTVERLRAIGEERWSCVFCKRALIQRACQLADEMGAQAVVMGDSLGQVASQTLSNMEVISYGAPKLILRPLVGMDKQDVVALAQSIGTFDISIRDSAPCPFLPAHPITRGTVPKLLEIIARLEQLEAEENETAG